MKIEDVFLTTTHQSLFRCGTPAKIVGVKMVTLKDKTERLCFHVQYQDGFEDYVAVGYIERTTCNITTFEDVVKSNYDHTI